MFNDFLYKLGHLGRKSGIHGQGSDLRIQKMQRTIRRLGGINFRIEKTPTGEWVAESTNIDGIITGGKDYPNDMNDNIKDAVFTYFEIPPHLCHEKDVKLSGEAAQVEEVVYA